VRTALAATALLVLATGASVAAARFLWGQPPSTISTGSSLWTMDDPWQPMP